MLHQNTLQSEILSLGSFEDYQDSDILMAISAHDSDLSDYAAHVANILRSTVLEGIYPSIKTAYNEWLLDGPSNPTLNRAVKLELGL